MRRYLLDTAPLGAYLLNRRGAMELIRPWIGRREVVSSILVYAEIIEYLHSLADVSRHRAQLRELLTEISPAVLTYRILERYAELRRQMRPPRGSGLIGDVDTLIAATALERRLTLVTVDADFRRVPGLNVLLLTRAELRERYSHRYFPWTDRGQDGPKLRIASTASPLWGNGPHASSPLDAGRSVDRSSRLPERQQVEEVASDSDPT